MDKESYEIVDPLIDEGVVIEECIGTLDTCLSQMLYLAKLNGLTVVDAQTLKHHAEDLIGVGQKMLTILELRKTIIPIP